MKYRTQTSRVLQLGVAAIGALLINGAVVAAEPDAEVVIQSSPQVHRTPYAERLVSITRTVSYADLDLVRHSDVRTLERRINDEAVSICEKLDRLYGMAGSDYTRCIREAVRGAMVEARAAIAKAEKRSRTAQVGTRG